MIKVRNALIVLIGILMLTNVCSAITYNVEAPNGISAAPGGSVEYTITVGDTGLVSNAGLPIDERFDFSAYPENVLSPDWSYNFKPQYIIVPSSGSSSTVLTIGVPLGTEAGTYQHHIVMQGSIDDPELAEFADLTMEVVQTDVSIPEFPTVAVPVLAVLGLVTIFGRRKSEL